MHTVVLLKELHSLVGGKKSKPVTTLQSELRGKGPSPMALGLERASQRRQSLRIKWVGKGSLHWSLDQSGQIGLRAVSVSGTVKAASV